MKVETFRMNLNPEPEQDWGPLRIAASFNLTDLMENCLWMGADVDFGGCSSGSPLVVAAGFGRPTAVGFLSPQLQSHTQENLVK